MKFPKYLAVLLAAFSLVALTGCAGRLTPQGAASLTSLAVYEAGKDNAKLTKQMRDIQPEACNIATNPAATILDVANAISDASGADTETKVIVNVIISILQTSVAPVGTNVVNQSPYIKAVICDGWGQGLEWLALAPDESGIVGEAPARRAKPTAKLPTGFVLIK